MKTCSFGENIIIKPDGIHELDSHIYELSEKYKNVTIEILKCKECGEISIGWYRQSDTIKIEEE